MIVVGHCWVSEGADATVDVIKYRVLKDEKRDMRTRCAYTQASVELQLGTEVQVHLHVRTVALIVRTEVATDRVCLAA